MLFMYSRRLRTSEIAVTNEGTNMSEHPGQKAPFNYLDTLMEPDTKESRARVISNICAVMDAQREHAIELADGMKIGGAVIGALGIMGMMTAAVAAPAAIAAVVIAQSCLGVAAGGAAISVLGMLAKKMGIDDYFTHESNKDAAVDRFLENRNAIAERIASGSTVRDAPAAVKSAPTAMKI